MAGAVGFEPTNADSKNRCSTLWFNKIVEIPIFKFTSFKKKDFVSVTKV